MLAENLHRADLTALERAQHVAEWIRLRESSEDKLPQVAAVSKGGRGKEGGIRAAARELGLDDDAARRAVKIDSLSSEAKQAAAETGAAFASPCLASFGATCAD